MSQGRGQQGYRQTRWLARRSGKRGPLGAIPPGWPSVAYFLAKRGSADRLPTGCARPPPPVFRESTIFRVAMAADATAWEEPFTPAATSPPASRLLGSARTSALASSLM